MKGFIKFVREQGVVGMAVGLAIGTEAGKAVSAIVDHLISPLVGFILGGTDLTELAFTVGPATREVTIGYGAVLNSIITLLAVAFVIYYIVKKAGLDKLDVKKSDK